MRKYEVTTERITLKGRDRRTRLVDAEAFTQSKSTATFVANGRPVAAVKHVVRVCWA